MVEMHDECEDVNVPEMECEHKFRRLEPCTDWCEKCGAIRIISRHLRETGKDCNEWEERYEYRFPKRTEPNQGGTKGYVALAEKWEKEAKEAESIAFNQLDSAKGCMAVCNKAFATVWRKCAKELKAI